MSCSDEKGKGDISVATGLSVVWATPTSFPMPKVNLPSVSLLVPSPVRGAVPSSSSEKSSVRSIDVGASVVKVEGKIDCRTNPHSLLGGIQQMTYPDERENTNTLNVTATGENDNNLYVQYLPMDATVADLKELFNTEVGVDAAVTGSSSSAVCSAVIMMDLDKNRSKGYGFVLVNSAEFAVKAIAVLNGFAWRGKKLMVRLADKSPTQAAREGPKSANTRAGKKRIVKQSESKIAAPKEPRTSEEPRAAIAVGTWPTVNAPTSVLFSHLLENTKPVQRTNDKSSVAVKPANFVEKIDEDEPTLPWRNIYVKGLPIPWREHDVLQHFTRVYGAVDRVQLFYHWKVTNIKETSHVNEAQEMKEPSTVRKEEDFTRFKGIAKIVFHKSPDALKAVREGTGKPIDPFIWPDPLIIRYASESTTALSTKMGNSSAVLSSTTTSAKKSGGPTDSGVDGLLRKSGPSSSPSGKEERPRSRGLSARNASGSKATSRSDSSRVTKHQRGNSRPLSSGRGMTSYQQSGVASSRVPQPRPMVNGRVSTKKSKAQLNFDHSCLWGAATFAPLAPGATTVMVPQGHDAGAPDATSHGINANSATPQISQPQQTGWDQGESERQQHSISGPAHQLPAGGNPESPASQYPYESRSETSSTATPYFMGAVSTLRTHNPYSYPLPLSPSVAEDPQYQEPTTIPQITDSGYYGTGQQAQPQPSTNQDYVGPQSNPYNFTPQLGLGALRSSFGGWPSQQSPLQQVATSNSSFTSPTTAGVGSDIQQAPSSGHGGVMGMLTSNPYRRGPIDDREVTVHARHGRQQGVSELPVPPHLPPQVSERFNSQGDTVNADHHCHYCNNGTSVIASNMPYDTQRCEDVVYQVLGAFGEIVLVECIGTGQSIVIFASNSDALNAMQCLGSSVYNVQLYDCSVPMMW